MPFAPLYLIVGMHNRWMLLAGSAAIYAIAGLLNLNLPSWPVPGGWYFDPICWQFIFSMGMFIGLTVRAEPIPNYRPIFWLSVIYSITTALVVSNVFGTVPGLVDKAGLYLDWDKTNLGLTRIIDFPGTCLLDFPIADRMTAEVDVRLSTDDVVGAFAFCLQYSDPDEYIGPEFEGNLD